MSLRSVYGSRRAAPHEPKAPGEPLLSDEKFQQRTHQTVGKKFNTPDCQFSMLPVVNKPGHFITPITFLARNVCHKVEADLRKSMSTTMFLDEWECHKLVTFPPLPSF